MKIMSLKTTSLSNFNALLLMVHIWHLHKILTREYTLKWRLQQVLELNSC